MYFFILDETYSTLDPLCRFFCPNKCGRSYKWKSGLTQHLNYECGIEPMFKCFLCEKKCAQKSTMKMHMKKVHKVIEQNMLQW